MKKTISIILMAALFAAFFCMTIPGVSAVASGAYCNCSYSPVSANASVSNLPQGIVTAKKGEAIYLNVAVTSDIQLSKVEFYARPNGASAYSYVGAEIASNYIRYAYQRYVCPNADSVEILYKLYLTNGGYGEGSKKITLTDAASTANCSGFEAIKKEFPDGSHWYGCFDDSYQCAGWARKVFYEYHGYEYWVNNPGGNTVIKKTNSSYIYNGLKVGDLVRYKNDGHSVIITGIDGNYVYIADCNSDWNGIIRWDYRMSRDTLANTFTHAYTINK